MCKSKQIIIGTFLHSLSGRNQMEVENGHFHVLQATIIVQQESFTGENFRELWKTTIMRGQETTTEIELVQTKLVSQKATKWRPLIKATMSMWQFGKLLLDKYCCASEREATSMITALSPLSRIMTHALIMMSPYSIKIHAFKTFMKCLETAKFPKVFISEIFQLYGTKFTSSHIKQEWHC